MAVADDAERLGELGFGDPLAAGDRAAAEYRAIVPHPHRAEATLAAISVLRCDAGRLVLAQRADWSLDDGRRLPSFR